MLLDSVAIESIASNADETKSRTHKEGTGKMGKASRIMKIKIKHGFLIMLFLSEVLVIADYAFLTFLWILMVGWFV